MSAKRLRMGFGCWLQNHNHL